MAYLKPFNIDGSFIEVYTPAAGRVASVKIAPTGTPVLLEAAKFILTAAANVTFKDYAGNSVTTLAWPAATVFPFPVTEISVVSTGSIYIIHAGVPQFEQ